MILRALDWSRDTSYGVKKKYKIRKETSKLYNMLVHVCEWRDGDVYCVCDLKLQKGASDFR